MDEDLKLYIPLGVKPETELFTGFGKKQLFQALINIKNRNSLTSIRSRC